MEALEVAKYFLFLARSRNAGDTISNLKMQKMLYYAQGHCLALFKKPLFEERIEAWDYGPVVQSVYDCFKKYGSNSISFDELESFKTDNIAKNKDIMELLIFIFDKYGSMGAWKLSENTHKESPWKDSYCKNLNIEIPQSSIQSCFDSKYKKEALRLKKLQADDKDIQKYGFI